MTISFTLLVALIGVALLFDFLNGLHDLTARLVQLEGQVDDHHAKGLHALFKSCGDDQPMRFIVEREIYSHLERIADRFEDIANEIQGLVIDHA